VIGLYWIGHHRAFAHIRRFDHRLIVFNLVFLGLIAFQPWPNAVLGRYGGHRSAWRSPLAAQLSWFVVLRRVVERRYGGDDTREGAFA
jgi:uncharacterized membrane protein